MEGREALPRRGVKQDVSRKFSNTYVTITPMNLVNPSKNMKLAKCDYLVEEPKFYKGEAPRWDDVKSKKNAQVDELFVFTHKHNDLAEFFVIREKLGTEHRPAL